MHTQSYTRMHTERERRERETYYCNTMQGDSYRILGWPKVSSLQHHYAVLKILLQNLSSVSECNRHPWATFPFFQQGHPRSGASSLCALRELQSSRPQQNQHSPLEWQPPSHPSHPTLTCEQEQHPTISDPEQWLPIHVCLNMIYCTTWTIIMNFM